MLHISLTAACFIGQQSSADSTTTFKIPTTAATETTTPTPAATAKSNHCQ
jgi:hypothetical protein